MRNCKPLPNRKNTNHREEISFENRKQRKMTKKTKFSTWRTTCLFFLLTSVTCLASEENQLLFGTFKTPFSADSPWNVRPDQPILGEATIQKSIYYPTITEGKWSSGVFEARPSDSPVTIYPFDDRHGIWDPDAEAMRHSITIPHWPASVIPATGSDGHADIVDESLGIIHSFWQLRKEGDFWRAVQYSWTSLAGRGWGEPGHYFQGSRAAGVPTTGGLIRAHEINDGLPYYRHALAISLASNSLSPNPSYVFPATSADHGADKINTGNIPQGILLMLPPNYETKNIRNEKLLKVAETLKLYGGYVVDRNTGTPFVIYVQNGSNFRLMGDKWDNSIAHELDRIRSELRPVVSASGWIDGNNKPTKLTRHLNILSMRGDWHLIRGEAIGNYDTLKQSIIFPKAAVDTIQVNTGGRSINGSAIHWAEPSAGEPYKLTAHCTGGARIRIVLLSKNNIKLFDSGELSDGESVIFDWPAALNKTVVYALSSPNGSESSVNGTLVSLPTLIPRPSSSSKSTKTHSISGSN